ncbi:putative PepSY-like beta-lactamase-inhibitor [Flavobacterium sp. 90]|uniref:PepSY-like domain-containing protein n=1 Tax=unclassified Flavobacterium TaxID=196869 RepID=UPI000EB52213|nr:MULTISPECIES: PepSY-like domain-containing protein [unclassified Flavobacterium]RKR11176.1 putative PepSY-like beta-lactamase-inhibitor [Flavobacterium sp. 81]TCK54957.1 putative PepSY-like beta-lactamase-inhibitor [Flavobacterium sp. 90]
MRTKLNLTICLIAGLIFGFSANAQKTVIKKEALPANAQTFLKAHFGSKKPSYILEDKEILSTEYKVQYDNKTEIEFDKKGNWKEVDAKGSKIPSSIIPKKIASYVKTNFPKEKITKIELGSSSYETKLTNGLELKFNLKGDFTKIDK